VNPGYNEHLTLVKFNGIWGNFLTSFNLTLPQSTQPERLQSSLTQRSALTLPGKGSSLPDVKFKNYQKSPNIPSLIFGLIVFANFSVTEAERRRIQDAFRRLSAPSGYVSRQLFIREVLGDGVPASVAERIFALCGGGGSASSAINSNGSAGTSSGFSVGTQSRGLSFRDTLTVLVLLTRGTSEEKTKCKNYFWPMYLAKKLKVYLRSFSNNLLK